MSYFSDTFNPFLHAQISTIIPPEMIHDRLRRCELPRTSTNLLHCTLELLTEEVHSIEQNRGMHDLCTIHALDILGSLQSELNLHVQAATTYHKIVVIDDIKEQMALPMPKQFEWYQPLRPQRRYERNLEALFNLSLQLNKCNAFSEAEIYLRRLVLYTITRHGLHSFQYRNVLEQLMYALQGQGRRDGVKELWVEYQRSQDDEISELLYLQDLDPDDGLNDEDIDYLGAMESDTEGETETESESELQTPELSPSQVEPVIAISPATSQSSSLRQRKSPVLVLSTENIISKETTQLITC